MRSPAPLLAAGLLGLVAPLLAPAGVPAQGDDARPPIRMERTAADRAADRGEPGRPGGPPDGYVLGSNRPQTSDGVVGRAARDIPVYLRPLATVSNRLQTPIAPGVELSSWTTNDARGPVRLHLLTVKWRTPGLSIDYANSGSVRQTAPLTSMLARDKAVAGVNGDFFDIGDTGAPLGIGKDLQRGLIHGRHSGWNNAFYVSHQGWPDIATLDVTARVKHRPKLRITNVNSPFVYDDGIGVYTPAWGETAGYRVTEGQTRKVRAVTLRDGRVVGNTTRLPFGTRITGKVLIGRGQGARALRRLERGDLVRVERTMAGKMAITGNVFLLREGIVRVVDDRELHPRTAIGIDRDTKTVLLLAVDGRSGRSRGYTMVELAETMMALGADEALNLDGGGSTTMAVRRPGRPLGVVNRPSDGFQRSVANAVEIRYRKPRRR